MIYTDIMGEEHEYDITEENLKYKNKKIIKDEKPINEVLYGDGETLTEKEKKKKKLQEKMLTE